MNGVLPTSRRGMLGPMLALAAVANLPAPARAEASDPDEALLDIGRVWYLSAVRLNLLEEQLNQADERYVAPDIPEALFRQSGDGHLFFALRLGEHHSGRPWYGHQDTIESMRARVCNLIGEMWHGDRKMAEAVPNWPARRRRDEILAAFDRWQAERDAAADACGLTVATVAYNAAMAENRELRRRIMAASAVTMAGVLLKARVAAWCWGGAADMADSVEADLKHSRLSGEAVAFSAIADLAAMIERGAA